MSVLVLLYCHYETHIILRGTNFLIACYENLLVFYVCYNIIVFTSSSLNGYLSPWSVLKEAQTQCASIDDTKRGTTQ